MLYNTNTDLRADINFLCTAGVCVFVCVRARAAHPLRGYIHSICIILLYRPCTHSHLVFPVVIISNTKHIGFFISYFSFLLFPCCHGNFCRYYCHYSRCSLTNCSNGACEHFHFTSPHRDLTVYCR